MSRDDSCSYALQSLLNAPCAKASDGAEQCRLLSDNRVDFIQRELSVLPPHKGGAQPTGEEMGRSFGHVYEVRGDLLQQLP